MQQFRRLNMAAKRVAVAGCRTQMPVLQFRSMSMLNSHVSPAICGHKYFPQQIRAISSTKAELQQTLEEMAKLRCTAIVRTNSYEAGKSCVDAAIAGGFKCVEVTLSVPRALDLVEEYAKLPGITMAVGTIFTVEECIASAKAGAKVLVTPCFVPEVTKWCAENNIAHVCGIMTPTEAYNAHKLGAHVVKLFPGQAGGPLFVKGMRGPMPFLRVEPTTGVLLENVREYFEAGSFHVGWTAVLFPPAEVANGEWGKITARAKSYVDACNAAPGLEAALAAAKLQ